MATEMGTWKKFLRTSQNLPVCNKPVLLTPLFPARHLLANHLLLTRQDEVARKRDAPKGITRPEILSSVPFAFARIIVPSHSKSLIFLHTYFHVEGGTPHSKKNSGFLL